VKLGSLVTLRPAHGILGLARTELAKVFCRLWDYILEELKGDATEGFA
jgi:hypothetical protein